MANTRIPGTIIRSGSIPTTALGGGVVSSSAQVINHIDNQKITPAQITASGHIVPSATEIYDLGSSNLKFRDLYLSGSTIYLGTLALSDSGGTLAVSPSGSPAGTSSPVSGAFTGSFFGDIFATNGVISSSAQVIASLPTNTVSSSAQVTAFLPTGTVSSSGQVDITNTTNYTSFSSSIATIDTTQTSRLAALEDVTGSYAITGSNTFVSAQTISDTTNSTSYLDGALHVAGGMSVRKDVRVSGSLTVNGLLTAVSMSTQYVTASEYNVGVSKITLNDDDTVRFAGISIYDSGSSSPTSASIYWDSLQHRFIYENLSGSSYNSSIIMAGPKHTGSLGDEPTLTSGYVPYATGGDHIDNSVMFQSSSNIGIGTTNPSYRLHVNNIIASDFGFLLSNGQYTSIAGVPYAGMYLTEAASSDGFGALLVSSRSDVARPILFGTSNGSVSTERMRIALDGNIGIGTTNPTVNLQVSGTIATGDSTNGWGRLSYDAGVVRLIGSKNGTDAVDMALSTQASGGALSEKMRIIGAGSVGIGTTNPLATLHVFGSDLGFKITGTTRSQILLESSTATWQIETPTAAGNVPAGSLGIVQGGVGTRFTISGSGNVGIGTTNPSLAKLQVEGNGITINTEGSNTAKTLYFRYSDGGFITSDSYLAFKTGGSPTEKVRIDSSGNVGIGTTEVSSKFSIVGGSLTTTGNSALSFSAGLTTGRAGTYDAGNAAVIHTYYDSSTVEMSAGSTANYVSAISVTGNNASTFTGTVRLVTTSTERLRITPGGNVGIGTTNPSTQLDVFTTSTAGVTGSVANSTPIVKFVNLSGGAARGIEIGAPPGSVVGPAFIKVSGTGNRLAFINQSNTENVTILDGGNVGIGTTNPGEKLDVRGNVSLLGASDTYVIVTTSNGSGKSATRYENSADADNAYWLGRESDGSFRLYHDTGATFGAGNTSTRLYIDGSGRTGLGGSTITDVHLLNIQGSAATHNVGIVLNKTNATAQQWGITNSGPLTIYNYSLGSEALRILSGSNNVGIGTTNPTYRVSTQGTGDHRIYHYNSGTTTSDNAVIQAEVAGDNSGNAFFCAGKTGTVWSLGRNTSTGNFEIRSNFNLGNDASSRLIINSSGNVGIGTTNPEYKLHIPVNNNLYLSNLYITGTSQNPVLSSGATGGSMSFEGGGLGQGKIYIQGAASGGNGYIEFSIGGTSRATINSSGHFVPGADATYNLGSTSLRWANLYTADLHFSNKGKQNDVDGTWGDWTLQEGDENIFLLNHRNGKKYKIKLEEI